MRHRNIINVAGEVKSVKLAYTRQKNESEENFYNITLEVPRLSGASDNLVFVVTEDILAQNRISSGNKISISGTIRTRNYVDENKKPHVEVYGYVDELYILTASEYNDIEEKNNVYIEGAVCKTPQHRTTNSARVITDVILANNRDYHYKNANNDNHANKKSYYVPCITWGKQALSARNLNKGEEISVTGRFQSRTYHRKYDDTDHTVYEVSVISYEKLNKEGE